MLDLGIIQLGADAEDHLWKHSLLPEDAFSVIDEGRFKVFRDTKEAGRLLVVGHARGGEILTLVIERGSDTEDYVLITGWPSSRGEIAKFNQPGGSRRAK